MKTTNFIKITAILIFIVGLILIFSQFSDFNRADFLEGLFSGMGGSVLGLWIVVILVNLYKQKNIQSVLSQKAILNMSFSAGITGLISGLYLIVNSTNYFTEYFSVFILIWSLVVTSASITVILKSNKTVQE